MCVPGQAFPTNLEISCTVLIRVIEQIARQLTGKIGYPWTIRIFGVIMLFNSILILALGRPRKFKKEKRPLLELAAFKEPVYLIFSIGIFFTLWGLYIAYFYVSQLPHLTPGKSKGRSLLRFTFR